MKIRHLLLGVAIVALMAACGKKEQVENVVESATESVVEQVESAVEQVVETVNNETTTPAPAKATTTNKTQTTTTTAKTEPAKPAVDPCEAKVKEFENFVEELKAAKKNSSTPKGLTAYGELAQKAPAMEKGIQECKNNANASLVSRINNALVACKANR